ncbi:MAG: sugar ABC transporter permease, partial [Bacillota bacterium]
SLGVTLYYTALSVPGIVVTMFVLALLLNTKTKGISVFRTIFYIPAIVPAVAYSVLWMFIYQPQFGLINNLLEIIGIPPQDWIYGEKSVIPALALASIWGAGNTMIVYLAGLQGIPAELYESMEMDGGGAMHKLWFITVPMMSPVIFYNMTMTIITSMQTFTQSFIMTGGGPNNASLFYVLHMYRVAFYNQQMGYASAMSWLLFLLVGVITVIVFKLSDTWVFYESGGGDEK